MWDPAPPRLNGGIPMEGEGRGPRFPMREKLQILEDLNMLYIRQMAMSLQDAESRRRLERELRLRDGARRLLGACSRPEQALGAAKSLLLSSSRVLALSAELQRRKQAQLRPAPSATGPSDERVPCRGTVCLSDLRIPLMWKDTEYFGNKGELHRCAVFCLLQLGAEIQDTPLVLVDRTLTDICFEGAVLFPDAGPDFELRLELYGAALGGCPPRSLATRLSTSLGRSAGRRLRGHLEGGDGDGGAAPLLPHGAPGPRFQLLAHAVLSLAEVQDGFRTHDLSIASNEDSPCLVPLYGSVCCRLTAQPRCMARPGSSGTLRLEGTELRCHQHPGQPQRGAEPELIIAVNKETRVRALERGAQGLPLALAVTNRLGGEDVTHTLVAESAAEAQRWMEAFSQHFYDISCWQQCCEELMRIEVPQPRRAPAVLPRQGSLYHELALDPSEDAVAAMLEPGTPPWLSLFEGPPPSSPQPQRGGSPAPPPRPRPRSLSLDARLSPPQSRV
ncbi:rhotekin [Pezoporus flaviventris]|uniref:rhotekin n=1 Tax=Pezoporus flaviventris TaxID=889875 RepID=UPI002AB00435|nr:rhotekin [Pezoporus flaviventris]